MEQQLKAIFLETLKEAYALGVIPHPAPQNDGASPWKNAKGIAEYLGFEVNWVRKNLLHLAHRPGGSDPRWHIQEVDRWVLENKEGVPDQSLNINLSKRSRHVKF